jgi:glycine hydroxymethyltransferase
MHAIAARAVAFQEALQPSFLDYQRNILDNAQALAAELKKLGLRLVSGGTDNHIVLVDLTPIKVTGKDAQLALERVGIVVNRNSIPFDTNSNWITSGVRLGTPAMTTRGFTPTEMRLCANLIFKVLTHIGDVTVENQAKAEVQQWCHHFPIPGIDD